MAWITAAAAPGFRCSWYSGRRADKASPRANYGMAELQNSPPYRYRKAGLDGEAAGPNQLEGVGPRCQRFDVGRERQAALEFALGEAGLPRRVRQRWRAPARDTKRQGQLRAAYSACPVLGERQIGRRAGVRSGMRARARECGDAAVGGQGGVHGAWSPANPLAVRGGGPQGAPAVPVEVPREDLTGR